MKKQDLFLGCALFALCTASCSRKTAETQAQWVRVDTVVTDHGGETLDFPGRVKSAQDMNLSFRVSGSLQRIYVKDGAYVKKGQLLAQLDPTDYQVQLNATEAEYKQVKAEAERVIALYNENGTTPNAYDKARYGLQQITAKYKNHKDQLTYTRLYAPANGYVQKRLFEEHETVAAGMPILSMMGGSAPEVEISLPASDYARRQQFAGYSCTLDIFPGETFPLQFVSVAPSANANQLYSMRLRFTSWPQNAKPTPGMAATVSVNYSTNGTTTLCVPSGGVFEEGGKSYVYLFNASNKSVKKTEVSVKQLCTNGTTILTASGLKAGECIVSSGVHKLTDGQTVRPLPHASATNVGGLL